MGKNFAKGCLMLMVGIAVGCVIDLITGYFVMLLWNCLMPAIFGLPTITYWMAVGLNILTSMLFKSYTHTSTSKS